MRATLAHVLKKVLAGAAVLLVIGVATIVWLWRQATALPDWYTQADAPALETDRASADPEAPPRWIPIAEDGVTIAPRQVQPLSLPPTTEPPTAPAPAEPRPRTGPRRHELRGFHRRAGQDPAASAVRASRAVYEDGALQAGVILDLSRIPHETLAPRSRDLFERAIRNFPMLSQRDVYVGIEDDPVVEGGLPRLGPAPRIRVGKLRYSLDDAAHRLGMTPDELRRELDRELRRLGLPLD